MLRRRSSVVLGPRSFLLQLQSGLRSATQCYSGLNLKTECDNRKIIQLWSDEAEKVTVFLCVPANVFQCLCPAVPRSDSTLPSFNVGLFFFCLTAHCHYTLKILTCRAFEVTKKAWRLNRMFFLKLELLFHICNLWFYVNKMLMLVRNNQVNVGLAFQIQTI